MTAASLRAAAQRSLLWRALLPVRALVEVVAFLIALLTRSSGPRAGDRTAEAVFARSEVAGRAVRLLSFFERAWNDSAVRRLSAEWIRPFAGATAAERIRLAAIATSSAAITALGLRSAASRPSPYTWIVPLVAALCGVVIVMWAPVLAAALADRRRDD